VRTALGALPETIPVWEIDGQTIGQTHPDTFDRILLDAPCTGLGALRRRPEARWRKQPKDVADLAGLQSGLIDAALLALKPGGILAYVTCSPHTAETRAIVALAVRKAGGAVTALDTAAVVQSFSAANLDLPADSGSVQLWPHRHGTDAMFITLLQRAAE
jgi:16S rRNA (cytosine967-C5)-methyltransferase